MNPNPISQSQHQESTSLSIKRRGGKDEEKNKNPLLGDSEELVRGGGIQRVDEVGEHQRQDHQKVRDALVDGRCVAGGRLRGGLPGDGRHHDGEGERRGDDETEGGTPCHGSRLCAFSDPL